MFKAFDACAPHQVHHRPHGPDWLHEIKYDSYRLRLERDGDCVRLISRDGGPDRYPWIVQAARMVRLKRFVLDGEAVLDEISASAFNALQSRNHEAEFCAFNILVEGDDDLRRPPLHLRNRLGTGRRHRQRNPF